MKQVQHRTSPAGIQSSSRGAAKARDSTLMGLQRMADASQPVARLRQMSALAQMAPLQFKKNDVYSAQHFAAPEAYLAAQNPTHEVVEDGGSAGMASGIYRNAARALSSKKTRDRVIVKWQNKVDAIYAGGAVTKPEENRAAQILSAVSALERVVDFETAALFLRENSLTMSKGGIEMKKVHSNPGAVQSHTFHRDAGFVTVAADALNSSNGTPAKKAEALNGPGGRGWVQGHANISNYHHRFIEHVHVDKDDEQNRFEIYNAAAGAGPTADEWGEGKKDLLTPAGTDVTAVTEAEKGKKDSDLTAAKLWNAQQ